MPSPNNPSGPTGPRRTRLKRSSSLPNIHKLGSHPVERPPENSHTEHHSDIDPTPQEPLISRTAGELDSLDETAQKLQALVDSLAPTLTQLDPENALNSTEFGQQLKKATANILKIKNAINEDEKLSKKQKKKFLTKLETALTQTTQLYHTFQTGIASARIGTQDMNTVLANQKSKFETDSPQYQALNNLQGLLSKFQMATVSATTAIFNPNHPNADPESYQTMLALGTQIKEAAQQITQERLLQGDDLEKFNTAMASLKNLTDAQNALFELKDQLLADLSPKERKQLEKALTRVGYDEKELKAIGIKVLVTLGIIGLVAVAILTGTIVFTPALIGSVLVGLVIVNEFFLEDLSSLMPSQTLKNLDDYMATVDQLSE